jgi:uncharacterized protein
MSSLKISAANISLTAELNDSPTAKAIYEALPIESNAQRWGDEIYFRIPVKSELEPQARSDMAVGEIAYWPPGKAFCIFFGPTPVSRNKQPRAASPVNPIGKIIGDAAEFRAVKDGEKIKIEHLRK